MIWLQIALSLQCRKLGIRSYTVEWLSDLRRTLFDAYKSEPLTVVFLGFSHILDKSTGLDQSFVETWGNAITVKVCTLFRHFSAIFQRCLILQELLNLGTLILKTSKFGSIPYGNDVQANLELWVLATASPSASASPPPLIRGPGIDRHQQNWQPKTTSSDELKEWDRNEW